MNNPICETCRFWRVKSDVFGVCTNPQTNEQVHVIGLSLVLSILSKHDEDTPEHRALLERELDFRTREDFGCKHWER